MRGPAHAGHGTWREILKAKTAYLISIVNIAPLKIICVWKAVVHVGPCWSCVFVHVLSFLVIWSSCNLPFWIFHEHFGEESFIEKLLLLRQAASCSRGDLAFHDCTILFPVSIRMAFQWVATRAPTSALCFQERNHQWQVQRLSTLGSLGWFVWEFNTGGLATLTRLGLRRSKPYNRGIFAPLPSCCPLNPLLRFLPRQQMPHLKPWRLLAEASERSWTMGCF